MKTTIFIKKQRGFYHLWTRGFGFESPAGPRLIKGPNKAFQNGPPRIMFTHPTMAGAMEDMEKLQAYVDAL